MAFSPERLLELVDDLPSPAGLLVAYSGGLDSHVLLHALSRLEGRLPAPLRALHVNHGLQPAAGDWDRHCQKVCEELGVPCDSVELALTVEQGASLEARAREARYRALAGCMSSGDLLLVAQHQDDQAETLMLQLLRGAGVSGLSAMPRLAPFGPGYLGRPLLGFSQAELVDYAHSQQLTWIDDPSNTDHAFDRNFLRHRVLPTLRQRWPALGRTLSRSARHCAEAQGLIDELAGGDLEQVYDQAADGIRSDPLAALPPPRARAVLRAWIKGAGLPIPNSARLDRILNEMPGAREDRGPVVHWPGAEVRRYRRHLYLLSPLPRMDRSTRLDWDGSTALALPAGLGCLHLEPSETEGIAAEHCRRGRMEVRFGRLSGRLLLPGRSGSKRCKHFYQEHGIPPWQRDRMPLLYIDGVLAAVADLTVTRDFAFTPGEQQGLRLVWMRSKR